MMTHQMQLSLFGDTPSVDELLKKKEDQWFDRKSFRIAPHKLAETMIGFANADGGRIAIGISDGRIEGVNSDPSHVCALQQAAIDYTEPPVRHSSVLLDCIDHTGAANKLLVLDVEASESVHRNKRSECFLRVGDETRSLGHQQERELAFDKGEAIFDGTIVRDLVREDLDLELIAHYAEKVGSTDIAGLMRSRGIYYDLPHRKGVTQAGWLLFGHVTPVWCYVRYLRYSGKTIETGSRSNLTHDVLLTGTIPSLIEQTKNLLSSELESVIRLAQSGRFERMPTVPEAAWLEAVVNAVTHRSYSLQGDGVRVIQFDDRLEVESPGRLPGLVRVQNIRNLRFSRNPHIARVLAELTGYVRELNEGVKRMFEEMARHGLPEPRYTVSDSSVRVTLFKYPEQRADREAVNAQLAQLQRTIGVERLGRLLAWLRIKKVARTQEAARFLGLSIRPTRAYLSLLRDHGMLKLEARSPRDPNTHWVVTDSALWDEEGFRSQG